MAEPSRSRVAPEQPALLGGGIEPVRESLVNLGRCRLGHTFSIGTGCDVIAVLLNQPTLPWGVSSLSSQDSSADTWSDFVGQPGPGVRM